MSRPNLTVRTNVQVFDILFEHKRASLVSFQDGDGSKQYRAEREIIVCAGAIGSPQLLMLSGIGPADHLRSIGVPVLCDLPGVGANLQDHPAVPVAYECKQPVTLATAETLANLVRYTAFKTGPLSSNVAEAGGFVRTATACTSPDVQYHSSSTVSRKSRNTLTPSSPHWYARSAGEASLCAPATRSIPR